MSSTNKVAKDLAEREEKDFVVQADKQTEGRGRKDRSWISPKGGLYFSICTDKESLLPLKASIAVAEVLEDLGVSPELKWPNDVLVKDKKICGILVETIGKRAVVGIGLNVKKAPLDDSTCLSSISDRSTSLENLMNDIIERFYDHGGVLKTYKEYCSTIGKRVKISTPGEEITGTVVDIDEDGRLVLESGKKILSGDVVHLRRKKSG